MVSPFAGRNLRWLLDSRTEAHPDREFLIWRDFSGGRAAWTYAAFRRDVDRVAGGFLACGIGPGDRVAVHLDNCPEFLLSWFALADIGAVMVATNTRCVSSELRALLDRARVRAIVTSPASATTVLDAAPPTTSRLFVVGARPDDRFASFDVLAAGPPAGELPTVTPEAPAGIQFTSGTTADPKGVVWTQANYLWGAKVSATHAGFESAERTLVCLPLFHTNAQTWSVMPTLWVGGTVVLVPRFSARNFWPIAVEERTSFCSMIPFAVRALLDRPVPDDHYFRAWGTAFVHRGWQRRFRLHTLGWYGMTETVSQCIVSEFASSAAHGTMGVPAPEYGIRIVNEDGRAQAGPGYGALEVRGVPGLSLALGYLDDPAATADSMTPDGWFRTGDRVTVHDDGSLSFLDREKDMLKIGGENVTATEIEQVIARVDGVADSAVVGRPDRMLDEVAVAFVVPTEEPPADLPIRIELECRRHLSDFKVPRAIYLVDELPRVSLEKVAKSQLRERARALDV